MEIITTTTTTINPDIYRYGGFRYSLRAPDGYGFNDIIPQESSLYTFPKGDQENPEDKP